MDLKEAKKISSTLKPQFNIGKNNVTETVERTIDEYLTAHNIVKIKASIAADKGDLKRIAGDVSSKLKAVLVDVRGFTFTLYRE